MERGAFTMIDERVYTVLDIAKILRVTPQTVRKMIRDGELAAFIVRDEYRIRQSALDAFVRDTGTMKAIRPDTMDGEDSVAK